MLAPHEIAPAFQSLFEVMTRQASDIKTASYNTSLEKVLRKKIASAIVHLASREDDASLRETIRSTRFQIHNTALLSLLGIDISQMDTRSLKRFQQVSDPKRLLKGLSRSLNEEGTRYLDLLFEGTEHADADDQKKEALALQFLRKSEKATEYVDRVFGLVKKARAAEGYVGSDTIGGIPASEYISEIITKSLVGIEDASDDLDYLLQATSVRRLSNTSLYGKVLRKALRRRVAVAKIAGTEAVGKPPYTWARRSKSALNEMSYLGTKVLDIIKTDLAKDRSAQIGSAEQFDTLMENVTETYSELVDMISEDEVKNDTEESRTSFSEIKKAYEDDPDNEDLAVDFAKIIMTRIRTSGMSRRDARWLLDNINHFSEDASLQEKAREVIYDVLFKRGWLEDYELNYLDGVFDEDDLRKAMIVELRKLRRSTRKLPNLRVTGDDADSILDSLEKTFGQADSAWVDIQKLRNRVKALGDDLYTKEDISLYLSFRDIFREKEVSGVIRFFESAIAKAQEALNLTQGSEDEDVAEEYVDDFKAFFGDFLTLLVEMGKMTPENFGNLTDQAEIEVGTTPAPIIKNVFKPTVQESRSGGKYLKGAHPLNGYSISNYTGKTLEPDVGMTLGGQTSGSYKLTALDARVATQVTRALELDESFKEELSQVNLKKADYDRLLESLGIFASSNDGGQIEESVEGISAFLLRNTDEELGEKLNDLIELESEGVKKRKTAVDKIVKDHLKGALDRLAGEYKSAYTSRMSRAVDSVYEEVLRQETTEKQRAGSEDYVFRIQNKRTLENLSRNVTWESKDLELRNLLRADRKAARSQEDTDKAVAEALNGLSAWLKENAEGDSLLTEVAQEKSLTLEKSKKGNYVAGEVSPNEVRSLLTAVGKRLRSKIEEDYKAKALRKTEEQIAQAQRDTLGALNQADLADVEPGSVAGLYKTLKVGDIQRADRLIRRMKAQLGEGANEAKKAIDDFREAMILGNVVTFEDRIRKKMSEEAEKIVSETEKEREKEFKRLSALKEPSEEERNKLKEMQDGVDSYTSTIIRNSGMMRADAIKKALSRARAERSQTSRARYAPAIESKREAIRESARKMVEGAVERFTSSEVYDNPLADQGEDILQTGELSKAKSRGIKERSRALKKLHALRERFGAEVPNVLVDNLIEDQMDSMITFIQNNLSLFPSFDPSRDSNVSLAYLKTPFNPRPQLTSSNGDVSPLRTNVFQDINYNNNIRSFVRTLYASANAELLLQSGLAEIQASQEQKSFYDKFFASAIGSLIRARLKEEYGSEPSFDAEAFKDGMKNDSSFAYYLLTAFDDQASLVSSHITDLQSQVNGNYATIFGNANVLAVTATSNFKGLLSDITLLLTLSKLLNLTSISESEVASAGFDPDKVIEFAEIFGSDKKDLFAGA